MVPQNRASVKIRVLTSSDREIGHARRSALRFVGRMRPRVFAGACVVVAALFPAGCARSAEERQLDEMREEIEHIQADRDRTDRDTMQPEAADTTPARPPVRNSPGPSAPAPPPPVVDLGEGATDSLDDESAADPQDATPRPTIRVFGSPRAGARGSWRGEQVDPSVDDGSSGMSSPRPSALDPEAKRAYDAALSLVTARQYDKGLDALAAFLLKWPDHPYADNAMYWRGECYFAKGDYLRAAEQFEGVISRFPAGNKAPDALLKLGISHQKLGNPMKAKECFDHLSQQYPQSEAARRIPPVTVPATTPPGPAPEDHR